MDHEPDYEDDFQFDDFGDFDEFDEDPERLVLRLRQQIEEGQLELREALVEALMQWAWLLSHERRSSEAVDCFDEVIALCETLLDEGRFDFLAFLGKAKLQRALELSAHDDSDGVPLELSKAVGFLEKLVLDGADECRCELAAGLVFLSDAMCVKLQSFSAALFHLDKAIELWKELIGEGEDEYKRSLAIALRARGDVLREIGAKTESEQAYESSLELFRELDENDPEETPHVEFLRCLVHYAKALARFREHLKAHRMYDDAIRKARELPEIDRETICDWLPMLYVDKARLYRDTWEFTAALGAFELALQEFEAIRGEKAKANLPSPEQIQTESTQEFYDQDSLPDFLLSSEEEDEVDEEAESDLDLDFFELMEAEAEQSRIAWEDYIDCQIAHIHTNRGCLLHDLDRFNESQAAFDAASFHYLRVRDRGKSDVRIDLCLVRLNNAKILLDVRRHAEAIEIQRQAIAELEEFIAEGKTGLRANLAQALREIGISFHFADQETDALDMLEQSVKIWREIIDEGALEKREQLAHSLLVRSDFLLEHHRYEEALRGYLESLRIRKELFEEGDWLVALPLVRTLFSAAKASHFLGEYQQSLDWSVQSLKILEQIRNKEVIDVDDYILEGARRCMGILLDMHNPEAVLQQLEKTFRFIENLRAQGKHSALIDVEIPHFYMYQAHALGMQRKYRQEIDFDLKAISAWKKLLAELDRENDPKAKAKEIDFLTELGQSYSFLARAYDRLEDHENELQSYLDLEEVYDTLQELPYDLQEEERIANRVRIAITLTQLRRTAEAGEEFQRVRHRIGSVDPNLGFPVLETDAKEPRLPKMVLWFYPQFAQFLSEQGRFEDAIETLNVAILLIRYLLDTKGEQTPAHGDLRDLLVYRLYNLAEFQSEAGKIKEAYKSLQESLNRLRDQIHQGVQGHKTLLAKLLEHLLDALRRLDREAEREPLLESTYRFLKERHELDEDSRTSLGTVLKLWGELLDERAEYSEAQLKYTEALLALSSPNEVSALSSSLYRETKTALARTLLRKDQAHEALPLIEEMLEYLEQRKRESAENRPEIDAELINVTNTLGLEERIAPPLALSEEEQEELATLKELRDAARNMLLPNESED